jgi:hypothetical protein
MAEVYIGINRDDGSVVHYAFQTHMRCPVNPGGPWRRVDDGWERDASDANIEFDVMRLTRYWANRKDEDGNPDPDAAMVSWRRLTQAEHEMFEKDREYRDALEDAGGKIQHNMTKAAELHRARIRHDNGDRFMTMDRDWVDAMARGDKQGADAVEAQRKAMRDAVNDPRINAARSIDDLKAIAPRAARRGRR